MVVRLWQRNSTGVHRAGGHGRGAGIFVCPIVFTGVRDARIHHQPGAVRQLPSRDALLWRFGHGANGGRAHGADIFVRLLQVPARNELDDRRAVARFHLGDGIYRSVVAMGPNCDVVSGCRCRTGRPRAVDR